MTLRNKGKALLARAEILRYIIIGGLTTLVNLLLTYVGNSLFGMEYYAYTNRAAIWLSIAFAYITNRTFVFRSKGKIWSELIRFAASRLIISTLFEDWGNLFMYTTLGFKATVPFFPNLPWSKLISMVFVVIANYVVGKFLVFRKQKVDAQYSSMDYAGARAYLEETLTFGIKPGMERIKELCRRLDNPQQKLKCVHIAGTNGKGSTASYCAHILAMAGYKTGLFTSPYIETFTERIRIMEKDTVAVDPYTKIPGEIGEQAFAEIMNIIAPIVVSMKEDGFEQPTEFELITAAAFLYFARQSCDYVVLETGLGGRLDSTNIIVAPEVSILTAIGYDHADILGETIAEIASEKCGIIKRGCPVVAFSPSLSGLSFAEQKTVKDIITDKCHELKAPLTFVDEGDFFQGEVSIVSHSGQKFIDSESEEYFTRLHGPYQIINAGLAITALRKMVGVGAIKEGIARAIWPARFEFCRFRPPVILDGAHNLQACTVLKDSLEQKFRNKHINIMLGVLTDKNWEEMVKIMFADTDYRVDYVFVTNPPNPRKLSANTLAAVIRRELAADSVDDVENYGYNTYVKAIDDPVRAAELALAQTIDTKTPLVVFGSLYLAGKVRPVLIAQNDFSTEGRHELG